MFDIKSIREIKTVKHSERQKVVLAEGTDGKRYLKREIKGDKREIYKLLEKINHSNIPKVHYVEFDSHTVVIEEYVEGMSLNEFMEQNKKLNKKQVRSIAQQILSAMDTLHKHEIIHRDIKPDNVIIDDANHIWVTDYDIARIYRNEIRRDTEMLGTFGYAPIEQYGMLPTDFKTDIYAFGVTLMSLMEYGNLKGFLRTIAEKCKRLDPSQRYKNVGAVKWAIRLESLKYLLLSAVIAFVLVIASVFLLNSGEKPKSSSEQINVEPFYDDGESGLKDEDDLEQMEENESTVETEQEKPSENVTEKKTELPEPKQELEEREKEVENITFEGSFYGFSEGTKEGEYKTYSLFSNVCVFSMQQAWEHLLFLEDMNKSGKIKLGKNDTVVSANITLTDGELKVTLEDDIGHSYSNKFRFENQYEFEQLYSNALRKNADIICYDFDGDSGDELIIGINEGELGVVGKQIYNNFNYCIAWCIRYDEADGFTLCEGDMFSKEYAFWINDAVRKLNVSWEDFGDVTGYLLEGNRIIPN